MRILVIPTVDLQVSHINSGPLACIKPFFLNNGLHSERDHAKILQLPIDLEHRSKEVKCGWLKKQFKALVKHYHPDKYKGNKKRAARKFKEVKEAKEIISSQWNC